MRHKKFSSIGNDLTDQMKPNTNNTNTNNTKTNNTYKTKRKIKDIIVHCSFSPQGRDDVYDIDRWHQQRWGKTSGVGYHYVILDDGTVQKGRWVDYAGAHIKGRNSDTIGVCRTGGLQAGQAVYDCTKEQLKALAQTCYVLMKLYDLDVTRIKGHNEMYVNKSCPLLDMDLLREMIQDLDA